MSADEWIPMVGYFKQFDRIYETHPYFEAFENTILYYFVAFTYAHLFTYFLPPLPLYLITSISIFLIGFPVEAQLIKRFPIRMLSWDRYNPSTFRFVAYHAACFWSFGFAMAVIL